MAEVFNARPTACEFPRKEERGNMSWPSTFVLPASYVLPRERKRCISTQLPLIKKDKCVLTSKLLPVLRLPERRGGGPGTVLVLPASTYCGRDRGVHTHTHCCNGKIFYPTECIGLPWTAVTHYPLPLGVSVEYVYRWVFRYHGVSSYSISQTKVCKIKTTPTGGTRGFH
jgi:hypothetical protein